MDHEISEARDRAILIEPRSVFVDAYVGSEMATGKWSGRRVGRFANRARARRWLEGVGDPDLPLNDDLRIVELYD